MHKLTFPILHILSDGQFHSGEALAQRFGVTRATVWNILQAAQESGVELFCLRGQGYRLPYPVSWLDESAMMAQLAASGLPWQVVLYDVLPSTNAGLMQQISHGAASGTCVVARLQTAGRGRRGRVWRTGLGSALTFSLLWHFRCGVSALSGLSLVAGVVLVRALAELGVSDARLKWPNDVLRHQHKLAGILIEMHGDLEESCKVVIGVGLNLQLTPAMRATIDQPCADLCDVLTTDVTANHLLVTVLRHFSVALPQFEREGFAAFRDEWHLMHDYQDAAVRISLPDGQQQQGRVRGVDDDGALQVETHVGLQRFAVGEISLRRDA